MGHYLKSFSELEEEVDFILAHHKILTIADSAVIGENVKIWHFAQVREKAIIGDNCIIGRGAYIGEGVYLGKNCKVQNYACLYKGAQLEDGVFIGPHAIITNDKYPRAVNPDGTLKDASDWHCSRTTIEKGASIGTSAVIIGGVTVGRWAMVGACSVVTHDVPPHAVVYGNPARIVGYVDKEGRVVTYEGERHLISSEKYKRLVEGSWAEENKLEDIA